MATITEIAERFALGNVLSELEDQNEQLRQRVSELEMALRQARVGLYSIQQVAQGWKVLSFDQRSWALQDIYEGATIDLGLVDKLMTK